jgi:hypothetical protein
MLLFHGRLHIEPERRDGPICQQHEFGLQESQGRAESDDRSQPTFNNVPVIHHHPTSKGFSLPGAWLKLIAEEHRPTHFGGISDCIRRPVDATVLLDHASECGPAEPGRPKPVFFSCRRAAVR